MLISEREEVTSSELPEETPLLGGGDGNSIPESKPSVWQEFAKYAGALLFVFAVGVAAWAVDGFIHRDQARSKPEEEVIEWRSQVLGWVSAVMYCKCIRSPRYSIAHPSGSGCTGTTDR